MFHYFSSLLLYSRLCTDYTYYPTVNSSVASSFLMLQYVQVLHVLLVGCYELQTELLAAIYSSSLLFSHLEEKPLQ